MRASTKTSNSWLTLNAWLPKHGRVFLALLVYKVVYLLAISVALLIHPEDTHEDFYHSARVVVKPDGKLTFGCHFASWDAEHYLFIAAHGYEAGTGRCAFYPLFPLTIRYFSAITGISQLVSGMILANVFSLTGWWLFYVIVCERFGESIAKLALILLVAFPGSLFFQFVYTESLFFLLMMLLVIAIEHDYYWLAWIAACLLPLTRPVGIFCICLLLWHLASRSGPASWPYFKWLFSRHGGIDASDKSTHAARIRKIGISSKGNCYKNFWLLSAPFCGLAVYLLLMLMWTGNAFESFKAEKQFGTQSIGNILEIQSFTRTMFVLSNYQIGAAFDRISFILLLYSLPIAWRLSKDWLLWSIFVGIVPAMTGMFTSYTRYASIVFTLFIAMAVVLKMPGSLFRFVRMAVIIVFVTLQIILVWRFVNFRWAG